MAAVISELEAAMANSTIVRIERDANLRSLHGWVVAVGVRWCIVVAPVDLTTGNHRAVRLRDVRSVRVDRRAAHDGPAAGLRAAAPVGVDPTSTGTLLITASDAFGLVTVHVANRSRKAVTITGRVVWTADKRVTVGLVDHVTLERRRATTVRFRAISMIEFGRQALDDGQ